MITTTNLTSVSPSSVAAATIFPAHTITLSIPTGPRYHAIWIMGNAGTGLRGTSLIGEIRVKLNDKVQRVFTADELNKLNALMGAEYCAQGFLTPAANFYLPIFFSEPWRKALASAIGTAWNTGTYGAGKDAARSVDSFQIEIDIKAYGAGVAGVVPLTFKAEYEESYIDAAGNEVDAATVPIGAIEKVYNTQVASPGGGTAFGDYLLLPRSEPISQISIIDYANFVGYELRLNQQVFREDDKIGNEARLIRAGMLPNPTKTATPFLLATDVPNVTDSTQRGMVDIVPDFEDLITSVIPTTLNKKPVSSINLRLKTTTAAGTNIKTIYKTIGRPD